MTARLLTTEEVADRSASARPPSATGAISASVTPGCASAVGSSTTRQSATIGGRPRSRGSSPRTADDRSRHWARHRPGALSLPPCRGESAGCSAALRVDVVSLSLQFRSDAVEAKLGSQPEQLAPKQPDLQSDQADPDRGHGNHDGYHDHPPLPPGHGKGLLTAPADHPTAAAAALSEPRCTCSR